MNIALIIAAGKGARTGQDIPKQFINVNDKPIIIYTLESFERHPYIDLIEVVCLEGWEEILKAYAKQFDINKLKKVVLGGTSAQESIRNGIEGLNSICSKEDIIIIHDGIRPLVDEFVISDVIRKAVLHGNGVTSLPYNEQIFIKSNEDTTNEYIPRDSLKRVSTPQAYKFEKLVWAYDKAFQNNIGIHGSSYVNTLMVDLGETLYFASGSEKNLKITTAEDIELFRAMIKFKEGDWLK